MRKPLLSLLGLALLASIPTAALRAATTPIRLTRSDDRVRVELGGQLFTEFIFKGAPRPYCYPVLAADGTPLTRDFPMRKDTPGEETDHPHHRSLWFTHGDVNGIDFWAEGPGKGQIVTDDVKVANLGGGVGTIESTNRWVAADGKVVMTDETILRIRAVPGGRLIDWQVTLKAPADRPVILGDTKEGSMALRLAQWMTPPHTYQKKKTEGKGSIVNDAGVRDADAWGKRSTWVDYHAPKYGKIYGVAMFDHPQNPRHPTWWHVRDYGLFAANPFGQHDFEPAHKKNPKAGELEIAPGHRVTFRYRIYFHEGDEKAAGIAEIARAYAAGK